jgi:TPR repeat protein
VRGRWSGKQQVEAGNLPGDEPIIGWPAGADGAQPNAALAKKTPPWRAISANPVAQRDAGSAAPSLKIALALEAARNSGFHAQPGVAIRDAKSILNINSSCADVRRAVEKQPRPTACHAVKWKTNAHHTKEERTNIMAQNDELMAMYLAAQLAFFERNYALAESMVRAAAEEGHPNSQCMLGLLYELGRGVP